MSTYTPSLGLELITPGSQAGLWGNTTNNTFTLIDQAITGVTPISFASASGSTYTLTDFNGAEDEARSAVINVTGSASGSNTIVVPNKQKTYLVRNDTGQDVVFQTSSPSSSYTVGAGYSILIFCDGNNNVFTGIASPSVGTLSVNAGGTGATTFGSGGFIKSTGGTNALTVSSKVALASDVSGTLPVANGGTGQTSLTSGALLIGNGTGAAAFLSGGTVGYVPTWAGSTWVAAAPASAGISSVTAGGGISVNGGVGPVTSGSLAIANTGVTSITASTGLTASGSTGGITLTNTGVTSLAAGTGISLSGTSGAVTISTSGSSGVTSVGATAPIASSGGTAPTISISQASSVSNGYLSSTDWNTFNGKGTGTVTSVALSTGSTGLTVSGATSQTISSSGTFSLGGTLAVANGGTGSTSLAGAGIVTTSGTQTITGQKDFGSSNIVASSYNFTTSGSSIFKDGSGCTITINTVGLLQMTTSGTYNPTGVYGTISDVNLKENIVPARNYLSDLNKVNIVKYSLKDEHASEATKLGVIAQELEEIFPGMIGEEKGVKNVKLTVFIPMLIKAVQELTAEVEALKAAK